MDTLPFYQKLTLTSVKKSSQSHNLGKSYPALIVPLRLYICKGFSKFLSKHFIILPPILCPLICASLYIVRLKMAIENRRLITCGSSLLRSLVEIFFRLIRRMHNGIIYACVRDSHPTDTVAVQLIKRVKIVAIYHFVAILSRVVIGGCSCDLRKTLSVITFRRDTCRLCFCDSGFRLIMS